MLRPTTDLDKIHELRKFIDELKTAREEDADRLEGLSALCNDAEYAHELVRAQAENPRLRLELTAQKNLSKGNIARLLDAEAVLRKLDPEHPHFGKYPLPPPGPSDQPKPEPKRYVASGNSTRVVRAYSYLRHAADIVLWHGKQVEIDEMYSSMSCIVMCAFCVEAYLNHTLEQLYPDEFPVLKKKLSTYEKLFVVSKKIGYIPNTGARPYQSWEKARQLRDGFAHAVTERIEENWTECIAEWETPSALKTSWEKDCTFKTAERILGDVTQLIKEIHGHAGGGPLWSLSTTSGSSSIPPWYFGDADTESE